MHSSSLDPTTRLLASVADALSKARQNFPTSVTGRLILPCLGLSIVGIAVLVLLFTSLIWGPILLVTTLIYISMAVARMCTSVCSTSLRRIKMSANRISKAVVRAQHRPRAWLVEDVHHQQRAEALIKDQSKSHMVSWF